MSEIYEVGGHSVPLWQEGRVVENLTVKQFNGREMLAELYNGRTKIEI